MSGEIVHPSLLLDPEIVAALRAAAGEAEKLKRLTERQWAIVREQRWCKLFVPATWGGLGLTLPQALVLEEALAWVDGSTAWVVTLCGGAGWFVGFVDPTLRAVLFASPESCLVGSGAVLGTAEMTERGYVVTGAWPYATGAEDATAFTANCRLMRGGEPWLDGNGVQQVAAFVFYPQEVSVQRTWNMVGLAATGSHGFVVDRVEVPACRRFQIDPQRATLSGAVYRYPFLQLAEATLAVNLAGVARRFLELAEELCAGAGLTAAQTRLATARQALTNAVEVSWASLSQGGVIPESELAAVSETGKRLATIAREAVDVIYPSCGLRAAEGGSEINRVWRNLHTASQHALLQPSAG